MFIVHEFMGLRVDVFACAFR